MAWTREDDAVVIAGVLANEPNKIIMGKLRGERSIDAIQARVAILRRYGRLPKATGTLPRQFVKRGQAAHAGPDAAPPAPSFELPASPQSAGMRKCLGPGCGKPFYSKNAGNRLCPSCKGRVATLGDGTAFDRPAIIHR